MTFCDDIRFQMDELVRDETIPTELREHLAICSACRREWEFARELHASFREESTQERDDHRESIDRVMAAILREAERPKVLRFSSLVRAAAAFLVILGGSLFIIDQLARDEASSRDPAPALADGRGTRSVDPESEGRSVTPRFRIEREHFSGTPGTFVTTKWAGESHVAWVSHVPGTTPRHRSRDQALSTAYVASEIGPGELRGEFEKAPFPVLGTRVSWDDGASFGGP